MRRSELHRTSRDRHVRSEGAGNALGQRRQDQGAGGEDTEYSHLEHDDDWTSEGQCSAGAHSGAMLESLHLFKTQ